MTEREMFELLVSEGMSIPGSCGLMANLKAESGLNPKNLQNSGNKKLDMTDEEYTTAVDSGQYTNFVRDSMGYGYAQWTYWSRKEGLLNMARSCGCSIGDPEMQMKYLLKELFGYREVMTILKMAKTVKEATDIVLMKFERPASVCNYEKNPNAQNKAILDQAKAVREQYGNEFLSLFSDEKEEEIKLTESQVRQRVVDIAVAWYGRKEADGSHQEIIDLYNKHKPLARGYKVKYTDSWCATYGSAVAIKAGYTDIIPTECGCGQMIELFRELGRWVENDAYVPEPGDYIFYDWDDTGKGDNTGWPEHVGIVVSASGNTLRIIEGNKGDAVSYRDITVNARYIRGYGVPDYASKATAEASGDSSGTASGNDNSSASSQGGLCMTPQWVGEVTADHLNVRKWAGKEYDNIKSWPSLAEGNLVDVCDKVKAADGSIWYYIRIDGRIYGFVHSDYIKQTGNQGAVEIKKGQVVNFTGCTHYTSSYATGTGKRCKPGKAKVTAINTGSEHPYHLVGVLGSGCTVYGWVDATDIEM